MVTWLISSEENAAPAAKWSSFERLWWLAILLPALCVGFFEFLRHQWLEPVLPGWLSEGWPGNVVGALVTAVVVYAFVRFFTEALQDLALEATRAREEAAVIVERQRIAREMHDSVAQALFYLTVKLREVEDLVLAGERGEAHGELRTVRGEIKAVYNQVRVVIADLRQQAELEDFGEAVRHTATRFAERLGVRVTCEVAGHVSLPLSSRQHVLAIVQEALINARRHGQAQHATVRLKKIGEETMVEISDEGTGFDLDTVPQEGGHGLTIMEERARMSGGRLALDSTPGRGTRVTVHLPGVAS